MAAALLSIIAFAPAAAQDTVTIDMKEVDGSGQSGSANITTDGEQVIVSIEIEPGPEGQAQPVHIHEGTCNDLGDVAYPLEDVVDGVSESSADISISDLFAGEYAINVHLSADEMDSYVSCGNTPLFGGGADDEEGEDEEGEEAAEEDEEASEEEGDDANEEEGDDEAAEDDESTEGDEADTEGEDESAESDDEGTDGEDEAAEGDDEAEDLVPATGDSGMGAESAVLMMTLLSGAALGAGLIVRRRFAQV